MQPPASQAPLQERRQHCRLPAELPVRLAFSALSRLSRLPWNRTVNGISKDVSLGGLRVSVEDPELLRLPPGEPVRLEIFLARPWQVLRCGGVVRNVVPTRTDEPRQVGFAFQDLCQHGERTLRYFVDQRRSMRPF